MKKICYITGTRAEFGLIESTLKLASAHPQLDISVCVMGTHILPEIGLLGETSKEIEDSGLKIVGRIESPSLALRSGVGMLQAFAAQIVGLVPLFEKEKFDFVMVLGDRAEMLAGALTAAHLNIPVIHIHAGERSGTIDESIRHAISKIAHYHFVATDSAQKRLIKMGERGENIFVTGAPGLDDIKAIPLIPPQDLFMKAGFSLTKKLVLAIYHPVLQEELDANEQMSSLIKAIKSLDLQAVFLNPNTDAGSLGILTALEKAKKEVNFRVFEHLERRQYLSWLAACDVMVGNSSSGIIEAASLKIPVVDIGSRQRSREASENVIRKLNSIEEIKDGISKSLNTGKRNFFNIYGDGTAGKKIVEILATLRQDPQVLNKLNTY
jgi:GDP/UDP-N,N'-diacetylbacillosamine 2-epimerase (hydrolysing)